jgi:hypothetical protein
MKFGIMALSTCVIFTSAGGVRAQDEEAEEAQAEATEDADETAAPTEVDAPPPAPVASEAGGKKDSLSSEEGGDGGRFRFGVAAGAGPLSADGLSLMYYGVDLRFGWQLSDALAIYAQPQLGYYKLDGASALFGSGGLIGTSVLADYTLFDRLFVGGGVGYAILNSPAGAELHLRAGGYPLVSRSDAKVRRRGLMLGVDFRIHFVEGYTFLAPTFNVGYDAF